MRHHELELRLFHRTVDGRLRWYVTLSRFEDLFGLGDTPEEAISNLDAQLEEEMARTLAAYQRILRTNHHEGPK